MPPHQHVAGSVWPGQLHAGGEVAELLIPLVAPHLEVDVDHVVVGDRQTQNPVRDGEGAHLVDRPIVPHHPHQPTPPLGAEGARFAARTQLGWSPGTVERPGLRDLDIADLLAGAQRDVPIGAGEGPVELEGDVLTHQHRSVVPDHHLDVGAGQVERFGGGRGGRSRQDDQYRQHGGGCRPPAAQKRTSGTSSVSASKKGRTVNPVIAATRLEGTVWTRLLKVRTESL